MKTCRHLLILLSATLLAACSAPRTTETTLYDFGPLSAASVPAGAPPALSVADTSAPAWLEGTGMVYRLNYANPQQMHSYAQNRWTMAPARLFEQRLKARLAQAGGKIAAASDGAVNLPVLRLDLDDFSQVFDTSEQSVAIITVRASLWHGRTLSAQQTFTRKMPAASANAAGGAAAMAAASDAIIADMTQWLNAAARR